MFIHVLRKMLRNKWMVLCLIIGSVLAVSTISSMPIYSNSIYQRMLIKDMQDYQVQNNEYPGQVTVYHSLGKASGAAEKLTGYQRVAEIMDGGWISELGLPIQAYSQSWSTIPLQTLPDRYADLGRDGISSQVVAAEGIEDHVELISGSCPSAEPADGYYEVMIAQNAMGYFSLSTGDTALILPYPGEEGIMEPVKIKVTGVFKYRDASDIYWSEKQSTLGKNLVMNSELYKSVFLTEDTVPMTSYSSWHYAVDYSQMRVSQSSFYRSVLERQNGVFTSATTVSSPMLDSLKSYSSRMGSLSVTLWILQIPVILMLLLYIFMVSKLIVDYDGNDIAVQKSRGASNLQIFNSYVVEGIAISVIAVLVGPFIGFGICKVLGLSNGFLEFVSRKGVLVELTPDTYLYSLLAIGAFLLTMLVPVLAAARGNIVKHKRAKSRNTDKPFWKKFYLDFVLLGVALYGLFSYQNSVKLLGDSGVSGAQAIDPLLFLISTLFILAVALLFLRFYPLMVRLVFWIGRKRWGAGAYASLIQVSRTRSSHFLMVFLIMTVSLGIFSSVSARSLNTFVEDRVKYQDGADLVLEETWPFKSIKVYVDDAGNMVPYDEESESSDPDDENNTVNAVSTVSYREPSFSKFLQLETIELATKVMKDTGATIKGNASNSSSLKAELMGVIPYEFGQMAWSREDLLPAHLNTYLNIMTQTPDAVFISRSAAEKGNIKPGDMISLSWSGQLKSVEVTVYGVVDYWPSLNPEKESAVDPDPVFIIGNLDYLNAGMLIRPYQVWMKRAEGVTTEEIYQEFEEKGISFTSLTNMQQDLVGEKNDPMLQGTNGTLTLSFIITMVITLIGFLIYWIFNIRNRTLQFGILRAMGLSKRSLIGMILWEQVLISGVAILAGLLIGTLASYLFVPLLQVVYSASEQVPPFRVIVYSGDYLRIFVILGLMLVVGSAVLGYIISKVKMDQALKLGED